MQTAPVREFRYGKAGFELLPELQPGVQYGSERADRTVGPLVAVSSSAA